MADTVNVSACEFTDGSDTHPIESEQWYQWLDSQNKFRYSGEPGTMTCYKQERSGSLCWYGQKRKDGILRTQYLGKSEDLTAKVLHDCCATLNLPKHQWLNRERKRATKSKAHDNKLSPSERSILEREIELKQEAKLECETLTIQCETLREKVEYLSQLNNSTKSHIECETIDEALDILRNALTLKANAGGKIKDQIRKAIALLKSDS